MKDFHLMTELDKLQKLANLISLNNIISPLIKEFNIIICYSYNSYYNEYDYDMILKYAIKDLNSEEFITLQTSGIAGFNYGISLADFLTKIRQLYAFVWLHELDEILMFNGETVFNQHGYSNDKIRPLWSSIGKELLPLTFSRHNGKISEARDWVPESQVTKETGLHSLPIDKLSKRNFNKLTKKTQVSNVVAVNHPKHKCWGLL